MARGEWKWFAERRAALRKWGKKSVLQSNHKSNLKQLRIKLHLLRSKCPRRGEKKRADTFTSFSLLHFFFFLWNRFLLLPVGFLVLRRCGRSSFFFRWAAPPLACLGLCSKWGGGGNLICPKPRRRRRRILGKPQAKRLLLFSQHPNFLVIKRGGADNESCRGGERK